MTRSDEVRSRWVLGGMAVFALAWAVTRAAVQSITIDESVSYNLFASRHLYLLFNANNHILNSTLMYGFTRLLGPSQFTARLPALLGAALYIGAAYRFCRLLGASLFLQATVFVCLVFNPFIFDYLVAARGYGLALGFLMWALVSFAESNLQGGPLVAACAISSACAAMSISANFSFAFVNLSAMLAILLGACYQRPKEKVSLVAACALPGTIIVVIACGRALSQFDRNQFFYGAHSLRDTFGSIIEASLFENRFTFLQPFVFPLVGVTGSLWLVYVLIRRAKAPMARFGLAAAAIFAVTAGIHWSAFRLFGLLLPNDRTAIYFFPLFMIAAGTLASIPPSSRPGRFLHAGFLGALAIMAVYFLLCLRLTYFKEWFWDADVQRAYSVLTCLNREHQVTRVASTWEYRGPLNFYQAASPSSIEAIDDMFDPQQTQVYVVDTFHSFDALSGKNWKIFYRSPVTDLVLAAPPQLASAYAAGNCFTAVKEINSEPYRQPHHETDPRLQR
jgi:hypothetical protein